MASKVVRRRAGVGARAPSSKVTAVTPKPDADGYTRRSGATASIRVNPFQRQAIEVFAKRLLDEGKIPMGTLVGWDGRVKLGPFLVWSTLELDLRTRPRDEEAPRRKKGGKR